MMAFGAHGKTETWRWHCGSPLVHVFFALFVQSASLSHLPPHVAAMSAIVINPLSCAKGKKFTCEMCGKAATLACQHCRVTYYCAKEHMSVDWFGIHEKVCQLLGALRTLRPTLGSEDERQRRNLTVQMSQHALIDLWYVALRINSRGQDRLQRPSQRADFSTGNSSVGSCCTCRSLCV
jgi:predicted RNA-binding Zn-ribbon protein involved in translation (DUF1610 family)